MLKQLLFHQPKKEIQFWKFLRVVIQLRIMELQKVKKMQIIDLTVHKSK